MEAHVKIYVTKETKAQINDIEFDEIAITSSFEIIDCHNEDKKSTFSLEDI